MQDVIKGFKNFLLRGDVIVIAVGLVVATAFSSLIKSFTTDIINPIVARAGGSNSVGAGIQLGTKGNLLTLINIGDLVAAIINFVVFMAVIYFVLIIPYKAISARRGIVVFGDPAPAKTCPACLSDDLPIAASKCKYCGTDQPSTAGV